MNHTIVALLGYITLFFILYGAIAGLRVSLTLSGQRKANAFSPAGDDVSEFSGRLCRAHANCYESFPFIGGLMLIALATDSSSITNPLALTLVAARILQSITHLASSSVIAVQLRFFFFLVQYGIGLYWLFQLAEKFMIQ